MHSQHIAHTDLKPGNIIISMNGPSLIGMEATVTDLGGAIHNNQCKLCCAAHRDTIVAVMKPSCASAQGGQVLPALGCRERIPCPLHPNVGRVSLLIGVLIRVQGVGREPLHALGCCGGGQGGVPQLPCVTGELLWLCLCFMHNVGCKKYIHAAVLVLRVIFASYIVHGTLSA